MYYIIKYQDYLLADFIDQQLQANEVVNEITNEIQAHQFVAFKAAPSNRENIAFIYLQRHYMKFYNY
jgi:hypothetical protein